MQARLKNDQLQMVQLGGQTMGTAYQVTIANPHMRDIEQLGQRIFDVVDQVDQQMSTYKVRSDICRFNAAPCGFWLELPREMLVVLKTAIEMAHQSCGAFDPTVFDVVDKWGFGPSDRSSTAEIFSPNTRPDGLSSIELDAARGKAIKHGDVKIDLCGIAKGYGVDQIANVLQCAGIFDFLVEIAGEVFASGTAADGSPWRLGLELPIPDRRVIYRYLDVKDIGVATSGGYRHFVEIDDVIYSHTIDPRTRLPVQTDILCVTVAHKDCMHADALATALQVMGLKKVLDCANKKNISAMFLSRSGQDGFTETQSEAFCSMFGLPDD